MHHIIHPVSNVSTVVHLKSINLLLVLLSTITLINKISHIVSNTQNSTRNRSQITKENQQSFIKILTTIYWIKHLGHIMAAKSKSRRTRSVVPNWPSSSTAGSTAAHFFNIILPSTMQDMKLVINENTVHY
jgi:hypothetical protein